MLVDEAEKDSTVLSAEMPLTTSDIMEVLVIWRSV